MILVFALGLIVGLLVNPVRQYGVKESLQWAKKEFTMDKKAQFIEPVSGKEKFDKARNITDLVQ